MKSNIAIATVVAVAAGSVSAGALDRVSDMLGSDSMKSLTLQVLDNCTALHNLGDPIGYVGSGADYAETAMTEGPWQTIAPMSRRMGSNLCPGPSTTGAEGMVIALDAVSVVGNQTTVGPEGIDYPGNAGDPNNQWRKVLRLIYMGMDTAAGTNSFARDCNSAARQNIVNNWDNVFHGTTTACTDSHPSVPGTGANGYDQSNSIIEPGIRHAFRRDDMSGVTDVFLAQLSLPGIDFAQAMPFTGTPAQMAVYRGLANSPFCNNKRPDDDWEPTTLDANGTLSLNKSQIPEMSNVGGVPAILGGGLGYTTLLKGSTNAKNLSPYLNEYTDQDPIRRKCVGRGNNAYANMPMEQVCGADGSLGVVLPISVPPDLSEAQTYPTLACEPSKGFYYGPALLRPTGAPVRCPNGDIAQDSKCLLPVRTQLGEPNEIAFDCINPPNNVPQAIYDKDGDGSIFSDAPNTDGRPDVDGRVYNLILRARNGDIRMVNRPDPSRQGTMDTPVAGAFYRIHSSRSLLLPPDHASHVCSTAHDSSDQIGCLTLASPCSIGYAGRVAISNNPGTLAAQINGTAYSLATVKALVTGSGPVYPMARKAYLNTIRGFDLVFGAEREMAKCFATLPFNGTINVESAQLGFVKLPPAFGTTFEKPLCEDFDSHFCGAPDNTDACLDNDTFDFAVFPTAFCDNGLKDGDETGPDVCPAARPTCNSLTHHCQ